MSFTIPREFHDDTLDYVAIVEAAARLISNTRKADPWGKTARAAQRKPDGDWSIWLVLAGRGFGKTRTGSEFIRDEVMTGRMGRVALVAPTAADTRDTMVEGPAGIIKTCERYKFDAKYYKSKRRIDFSNGAKAFMFSAEEPDRLRGPEHDGAWSDELAAWKYLEETWDMLQFGLRSGNNPQQIITSTPRPLKRIRELVAESKTGTHVVVTSGHTYENKENLAESFLRTIVKRYEGTRLGRQELYAEILEDIPGALWSLGLIDRFRVNYDDNSAPHLDQLRRIGIGVDPQTGEVDEESMSGHSETGIIVAALGPGDHGYVLDDVSISGTPYQWATRVVEAYDVYQADFVVAEANNGGAMVKANLQTVRPNLPVELVYASRGKITRAEPVASLYEQGDVHHIGAFAALEDQMTTFDGTGLSPDRMDALVWVLTKLMLGTAPNEVDRGIARAFHGLPRRRVTA